MAMEGWCYRAFLKLHYMREHPALILGPLKRYFLLGKIQEQGQSAGNFITCKAKDIGSSETTREAFVLKDNIFKSWFIGFTEGDGSFIINKDGYLEFRITQLFNLKYYRTSRLIYLHSFQVQVKFKQHLLIQADI